MRVIHCPPNEEPPVYARSALKRGGGFRLSGNAWIVLAIVAFVAWTVWAGPLKKQDPAPAHSEAPSPTAVVSAPPVVVEPVLCALPGGGMIEAGWTANVLDGEKLLKVRCMPDGTLEALDGGANGDGRGES